ncbi:MAG TPA: hypothetical protein VJJ52_04015 [Candidatus Nanoarchaeia archaeon]|nr:hypothetical protein [Candidatus Nanoarchaeia archaeon]
MNMCYSVSISMDRLGLVHLINGEILGKLDKIGAIILDCDGTATNLFSGENPDLIGDNMLNFLPPDLKKPLKGKKFRDLEAACDVPIGGM